MTGDDRRADLEGAGLVQGGFLFVFFFSSRRRHTRYWRDWSSDVCSSDLIYHARSLWRRFARAQTSSSWVFPSAIPSPTARDRKSTRLNSSHANISYAV